MAPSEFPRGVGCGYRPECAVDLLRRRDAVDFLEVVAETLYAQPYTRRAVLGLRGAVPLVPHGVKLSLGSAEPHELAQRAQKLGALARELDAPCVSEHVAMTRAGRRELGHLTPVAPTRALARVVAANVAVARRHLPDVPLLLENVAWTLRWPRDTTDAPLREGDFYAEVVEATGCPLLLDVANLYANARNAGLDPLDELARFPLERVAMLHVAGGMLEPDGFYLDTHAHPVDEAVFALVEAVFARCGRVPVVLERDALFPPFEQLAGELARLRALHDRAAPAEPPRRVAPAEPRGDERSAREEASRQRALAALLLDAPAPARSTEQSLPAFDPRELARTRAVLRHKRLDDAAPLLERLQRLRPGLDATALAALDAPAGDERQGVVDAFRIARAMRAHPERAVREAAARDLLLLRARFEGDDGDPPSVRPRRGPFVGHATLDAGRVWALKLPGEGAPVRVTLGRGERTA